MLSETSQKQQVKNQRLHINKKNPAKHAAMQDSMRFFPTSFFFPSNEKAPKGIGQSRLKNV